MRQPSYPLPQRRVQHPTPLACYVSCSPGARDDVRLAAAAGVLNSVPNNWSIAMAARDGVKSNSGWSSVLWAWGSSRAAWDRRRVGGVGGRQYAERADEADGWRDDNLGGLRCVSAGRGKVVRAVSRVKFSNTNSVEFRAQRPGPRSAHYHRPRTRSYVVQRSPSKIEYILTTNIRRNHFEAHNPN